MTRRNKHTVLIPLTGILSSLVLIILYAMSENEKLVLNGFIRDQKFSGVLKHISDLKQGNYYFAGATEHNIYLGNNSQQDELAIVQQGTKKIQYKKIIFPDTARIFWQTARLHIDSPAMVFLDGLTPAILRGNLEDYAFNRRDQAPPFFISSILTSQNNIVMNIFSRQNQQTVLLRYQINPVSENTTYKLQKQLDGMFCTQGSLSYDKATKTIAFTFMYRNEFLLFDTALHLKQAGNTIDTNSVAKLETRRLTDSSVALSSPPSVVNQFSCADNGYLYIQSKLFGDNEDPRYFVNKTIIDVYEISSGKYLGSFHIPSRLNEEKLHSFIIKGQSIFVLYGSQLASYSLNLSYPLKK